MSETNTPPCPLPKAGEFSWNELITSNTAASGEFYGKLFGWQITPFENPNAPVGVPPYLLFKTESTPMGVGGMMQAMHPGTPTQWVPYVVVVNVDASLAKAVELGAKVCLPVMVIPHVGRIACVMDPQGATLGLHEPVSQG